MESQQVRGIHSVPHANSPFAPTHKLLPSVSQPIEHTNYALSQPNLLQNLESGSSSLFNRYMSNSLVHFPLHIFSPNTSSSLNTDSTLNEPDNNDYQPGISHEKRLKRMISNRESARRSRMRRKQQIEELQCQVSQLQSMNHQLSDKVIRLLENNQQIIQENSQLKEKVSSLQVVLSDLLTPLRNVEESACNTNCPRVENSN